MPDNIYEINNLNFEILAREILSKGQEIRFRARGYSMRPFIREGDILIVKPLNKKDVHVGDIVLFGYDTGQMLAHRITKMCQHGDKTMYITCGDANRSPDVEITKEQILGRIVALERQGKVKNLNNTTNQIAARLWVALARIIKPMYFHLSSTNIYQELRTRLK